jgi:hypothetical protein
MRFSTRLVPGLLGLAMAAPLAAEAVGQELGGPQAPPIVLEHGVAPSQPGRAFAARPAASAAKHEHKGLLGRRSCTECQRAKAKSRDGIDVPPPPSALPPGAVPVGAGHQHQHAHVTAVAPGSTGCASCEADAASMGGTIVPGSIVVSDSRMEAPGRAVVGGEAVAAEFPTGRAVSGGAAPEPVGVARASQGNFTPVPGAMAAGPQAGPRDPSVMPSSMIPAQTAIGGTTARSPRIITHLLDLPDLTRIGREARARRDRADRSSHASISYQDGVGPVTELPASVVFGKGGR